MRHNRHFKQSGIGLIEVLIAILVVSLGLLALAGFQANLLSTSGTNKARAEAIGLAQQELELVRYAASRLDDFSAITSPEISSRTVNGTNAVFQVESTTSDTPATDTIINVVVDVTWANAKGDQDSVTLMSEVSLQDIQKSAYATNDSDGSVAVPSPRQSASEDVRPASENVDNPNVVSPTDTPLPATGTVGADDSRPSKLARTFSVNSTVDDTTFTLTAIADDSRYFNTSFGDGVLGVYVCDSTASNGCRYIQNHFGGISLSTSGIIYSADNTNNDLSLTDPVWSSSEVTACYEGVVEESGSGNDKVFMKPYECVYAGNCADDESRCQHGVTAEQIADKGVGSGGEFGNLGLIGLDGGNGGDQVCFLEDTPDWNNSENILNGNFDDNSGGNTQNNEDYLFPGTTRSYVSRRMLSNGNERSEGINKSFRNHNFLVTNRANSPDAYKNCYDVVNADADSLATYTLAPKNIVRVLSASDSNPVDETTSFAGVMPAITIRSVYSGEDPNLYINENGACYFDRDAADGEYACVVPDNFDLTTVQVFGSSSSIPSPTADSPAIATDYYFCNVDVNQTEPFNISATTPCEWSANFSPP